jgi:hypothetical protein
MTRNTRTSDEQQQAYHHQEEQQQEQHYEEQQQQYHQKRSQGTRTDSIIRGCYETKSMNQSEHVQETQGIWQHNEERWKRQLLSGAATVVLVKPSGSEITEPRQPITRSMLLGCHGRL